MPEIETREESQALQIASDALDRYMDAMDRELFRAGWLAGRDWEREHPRREPSWEPPAPKTRAEEAVAAGWRLVGCPHHPTSCTSVQDCTTRSRR